MKDEEQQTKQREAAIKAGKSIGASGRELFTFNPDMFVGDDEEAMEIDYTQREASDGEDGGEIDESLFEGEDLAELDLSDNE